MFCFQLFHVEISTDVVVVWSEEEIFKLKYELCKRAQEFGKFRCTWRHTRMTMCYCVRPQSGLFVLPLLASPNQLGPIWVGLTISLTLNMLEYGRYGNIIFVFVMKVIPSDRACHFSVNYYAYCTPTRFGKRPLWALSLHSTDSFQGRNALNLF